MNILVTLLIEGEQRIAILDMPTLTEKDFEKGVIPEPVFVKVRKMHPGALITSVSTNPETISYWVNRDL